LLGFLLFACAVAAKESHVDVPAKSEVSLL